MQLRSLERTLSTRGRLIEGGQQPRLPRVNLSGTVREHNATIRSTPSAVVYLYANT